MPLPRIRNILTNAGTNPKGGTGIQPDLKTFSALGAYGKSVFTALVALNTRGVDPVHPVPANFFVTQISHALCPDHMQERTT